MCDSEKKMVEDLHEGTKDLLFTFSLARSEVRTVRKTIAAALGKDDLPKDGTGVFEQFRLAANH